MTIHEGANPRLAIYLDNLLIQLRLLEVPGDRIGQILAEVETHLAETGLGPVEAFGQPQEYAATYAAVCARQTPVSLRRGWLWELGIAGVGATAGSAAFEGVLQLAGSVDLTARILGTWLATAAIGLIVVHALFALLARATAGSAMQRTFTSRYLVIGVLAWMAAVAVLVLIGQLPAGPTLVSVPGWVLFLVGVLAFVALLRKLRGDTVADPRR